MRNFQALSMQLVRIAKRRRGCLLCNIPGVICFVQTMAILRPNKSCLKLFIFSFLVLMIFFFWSNQQQNFRTPARVHEIG